MAEGAKKSPFRPKAEGALNCALVLLLRQIWNLTPKRKVNGFMISMGL